MNVFLLMSDELFIIFTIVLLNTFRMAASRVYFKLGHHRNFFFISTVWSGNKDLFDNVFFLMETPGWNDVLNCSDQNTR